MDTSITLRITVEDKQRLESAASITGTTLSAYCRRAILNKRMPVPVDPVCDTIMLSELGRVGRLLAQAWRSGADTRAADAELRSCLGQIKQEVQRRKFASLLSMPTMPEDTVNDNQKN